MRVNLRIFVYSYPLYPKDILTVSVCFFVGYCLFVYYVCLKSCVNPYVVMRAVSEPCICGTMKDQPASMSSLVRDAHVLGTSQAKACFV